MRITDDLTYGDAANHFAETVANAKTNGVARDEISLTLLCTNHGNSATSKITVAQAREIGDSTLVMRYLLDKVTPSGNPTVELIIVEI
jgi:hypothetical protein